MKPFCLYLRQMAIFFALMASKMTKRGPVFFFFVYFSFYTKNKHVIHKLLMSSWYDNELIGVAAGDCLWISTCGKSNDCGAYPRNHLVGAMPPRKSVQPERKSTSCYGDEPKNRMVYTKKTMLNRPKTDGKAPILINKW